MHFHNQKLSYIATGQLPNIRAVMLTSSLANSNLPRYEFSDADWCHEPGKARYKPQ